MLHTRELNKLGIDGLRNLRHKDIFRLNFLEMWNSDNKGFLHVVKDLPDVDISLLEDIAKFATKITGNENLTVKDISAVIRDFVFSLDAVVTDCKLYLTLGGITIPSTSDFLCELNKDIEELFETYGVALKKYVLSHKITTICEQYISENKYLYFNPLDGEYGKSANFLLKLDSKALYFILTATLTTLISDSEISEVKEFTSSQHSYLVANADNLTSLDDKDKIEFISKSEDSVKEGLRLLARKSVVSDRDTAHRHIGGDDIKNLNGFLYWGIINNNAQVSILATSIRDKFNSFM